MIDEQKSEQDSFPLKKKETSSTLFLPIQINRQIPSHNFSLGELRLKMFKKFRYSAMTLALVGALTVPMAAQAGGACLCTPAGCYCIIVIQ